MFVYTVNDNRGAGHLKFIGIGVYVVAAMHELSAHEIETKA